MEPALQSAPRRTGRPLSFDRAAALAVAMRLFWQHGFEATSIAELTQAMGITPPSLYAAFGDKRGLFREAVALYLGGVDSVAESITGAATARDAALALLAPTRQLQTLIVSWTSSAMVRLLATPSNSMQ